MVSINRHGTRADLDDVLAVYDDPETPLAQFGYAPDRDVVADCWAAAGKEGARYAKAAAAAERASLRYDLACRAYDAEADAVKSATARFEREIGKHEDTIKTKLMGGESTRFGLCSAASPTDVDYRHVALDRLMAHRVVVEALGHPTTYRLAEDGA